MITNLSHLRAKSNEVLVHSKSLLGRFSKS